MLQKPRPPLSTAQALARIEGQLPGGIEEMARITNRSVSLVRAWSDQDRRENIPLDDAIALDLAFQAAGGEGAPLADSYVFRLELAGLERFSDRFELLQRVGHVVREGGEAHAALIRACQPGAGPNERRDALREAVEAQEALKPVIAALEDLPAEPGQPP